MQSFWRSGFGVLYRLLALLDPLIRAVWRRFGIGNVLELRVDRRDGKGVRARLVGLLQSGGELYLGHPSGHVGWTLDLERAGGGVLAWPNGDEILFRAALLGMADEQRERAVRATTQHPFPGNVIYRLARSHVRRDGVFFRLDAG